MSINMRVTSIKDLKPFKSSWFVHVKVLHTWKQYSSLSGETLEIILADENGQKIHATCKKTYLESKGRLLKVGEWRNIQNFNLTPVTGSYRSTDHAYKMVFVQNTSITRSNHINEDLFLNLVDFQTILAGSLNNSYLIDVMGQVLDCGEVESIHCTGGKERKKLDCTLRDINDSRIQCCLWGNFAETLYSVCKKKDEMVICMLRFAKLGKFGGNLQVSNAFDASQLLINPLIPEVEDLTKTYNVEENALMLLEGHAELQEENNTQLEQSQNRVQRDKWLLFPTKSIQEMITSTQTGRCLVSCTIYANDLDWSWYYFGCNICNKKVQKVGTKVKKINGVEITTHIWWCEVCNNNVEAVSARFWIHLLVKDDTGVAKIMILDKVANGIVPESPSKLLNGSFDELEDPTLIPSAIKDLVGKTFTFGIHVEKDNISYGQEIFKVGKVYKDKMLCLTDALTESQSEKSTTVTSGDEGSIYLTDSQEFSNEMSTPSKRKEDSNGTLLDITSTSKKPCTRAIKKEKMGEIDSTTSN